MKSRITNITVVLFLLIYINPVKSLNQQTDPVNVTSLLFEYVLMCGYEFLCNKSVIDPPVQSNWNVYRDTYLCPDCKCDYACVSRGDCCPDIILNLPKTECVTSNVFPESPDNSVEFYHMVNKCPENADSKLKQECERSYTPVEKLQNLPVVSSKWTMTFKNRHCAMCNGISDFNTWNLNIDCQMFVDFNYLSSYEEILDEALKNFCNIKNEPGKFPAKKCALPSTHLNFCPKSFFYKNQKLTNDIVWACDYLDQSFGFFKNMFCFFCQLATRIYNNNVISSCNVTGSWKPYDQNLENACLTFTSTPATYPYKNIFCYSCNRNWFDDSRYLDSFAFVDEYLNSKPNFTYEYNLKIEHLKIPVVAFDKFTDSVKSLDNKNRNNFNQIQIKPFRSRSIVNYRLNMTNLMLKYYSMEGFSGTQMCYNFTDMIEENLKSKLYPCDCGTNCFFSSNPSFTPCCIDKAILTPVTCLSNQYLSTRKEKEINYVVVDYSNNHGQNQNVALCQSHAKQDNLLSTIPVNLFFDEIVYKHFYSFLCGGDISEKITMETLNHLLSNQIEPWDVQIICNEFLPFTRHQYLYEIIMLAKSENCLIQLLPKRVSKECENKSLIQFKECNQTGHWQNFDADVKWACENLEDPSLPSLQPYRNVFCKICNPEDSNNTVISRCNITGQWSIYDPDIERACQLFPVLNYYFPFKNNFCAKCNSRIFIFDVEEQHGSISIPDMPHFNREYHEIVLSTFRNVFAISSYSDESQQAEPNTTCLNGFYDWINEQCRPVNCYPGKRIVNGACKPLLSFTSNMTYSMSFGLHGNVISTSIDTVSILNEILTYIQKRIKEAINVKDIDFNSFHLLSNLSCGSRDSSINGSIKTRIDIRTTFSVSDFINRLESEENLLNITENGQDINFSSNDTTYSFNVIKNKDFKDVYKAKLASDFRKNCYIVQNSGHTFVPFQNYRTSFITQLLLCRNVLLDPSEYSLDEKKVELTVKKTGIIYSSQEFEITVDGKARLCVEYYSYKDYNRQRKSELETSLGFFTLICTVISLVCLFLTFVSYCILRKLRSLPGKNNMCLVFSLFCAQALLQFGLRQTKDPKLCQVIGVFLHFFWLSTFSCMNICCYHMFHVLGGSLSHQVGRKSDNKVLMYYLSYTVGVPVLIIGLNISIKTGTTSGYSIGYGGKMCFLDNVISAVLTFILPLLFVCISNTVFFSITLYKIRNAPKVQSNKENRHEVILYLKLFTLTGITWSLMIIDAFLPLSPFSFVVTILNGIQGVFIFVSYICNRRVLYLYLGLIRTGHPPYTTSFGSTFAKSNTTTTTSEISRSDNKTCSETIA